MDRDAQWLYEVWIIIGENIEMYIESQTDERLYPPRHVPRSCVSLSTLRICPYTGRFDAEKRRRFIFVVDFGENLRKFA